MKITRFVRRVLALALVPAACLSLSARADVHVLDDAASPVQVSFDDATGRMTVNVKATGTTWNQGTSGGQSWLLSGSVSQPDGLNLSVPALINSVPMTVGLQLEPASGELRVTLDNPAAGVAGSGIVYPYPFFTDSGDGYAICPVNSGYVVPTSDLSMPGKFGPIANRHMEFVGGSDATNHESWIGIIETPFDKNLSLSTFTVGGNQRVGIAPLWQGSNNNATHTPNLLSYDRVVRYHFFTGGGYVAVAKRFRQYAESQGWVKTLVEKIAENPAVLDVIGAPIIYLWGDGHDTAFLDELKSAGIDRALLQVSVNHTDEFGRFPNQQFADGSGWFDAVRAHGYRGGFYDIYQAARAAGGAGYSGFTSLWPTEARNGTWAYTNALGQKSIANGAYDICATEQEIFARTIRLPTYLSRFNMDATLFDTLCARPPSECYDALDGHFETRTDDVDSRAAILGAAYMNSVKPLLTGSEQARSWAVPNLIWAEGVQHLGNIDSQGVVGANLLGAFNGNAYPDITTNPVTPPTVAHLAALLSDGYQAPLWDLVYHDCILSTLHWERAENKFMYVWDHADLAALLRGQTALLNLTWQGAPGTQPDTPPAIITDVLGNRWSMRWSDSGDSTNFVKNRVLRTYNTVCAWHREVGLLEMTDHQWLTGDRSVQSSEFSADDGASGHGIVVNFGVYSGGPAVGGSTWTGTVRGQDLVVPINSYVTYDWTPPVITTTTLPDAGTNSLYQATLAASGGVSPFTWSIAGGTLPAGLSLDGASGLISGTPTAVGVFGFTVRVTENGGATATRAFTLTVRDTTPPVISSLTASPSSLRPPNHKMIAVAVTAAVADNVDPAPFTHIVSVTSNESANGNGDGNTATDWEITGDLTLMLRAERAGDGSDRVYTITVQSTDAAGNSSTGTVTVTVPH